MYSVLKPSVLYQDTSPDVTEHDVNVVSDLWTIDGRDVYRGARDPRYIHANVYWLYNEDLERVGCVEHDLADRANFRALWFHDSPFGTLLQEDGWTIAEDIWSYLPNQTCERFFNEGWTTPRPFLEQCLYGPLRVVTIETLVNPPNVYSCAKCGRKSLSQKGCLTTTEPLDFPNMEKVFFVDDDLVVHRPPTNSSVWSRLKLQCDGGSSQEQAGEQPPPHDAPPQHESPPPEQQQAPPPEPCCSPQSHPQTHQQPSTSAED